MKLESFWLLQLRASTLGASVGRTPFPDGRRLSYCGHSLAAARRRLARQTERLIKGKKLRVTEGC